MNDSKKRAIELFNKYYVSILEINNDLSEEIIISILAKKHALMAVDEILKVAFYSPPDCYNFYLNVKIEIEKL